MCSTAWALRGLWTTDQSEIVKDRLHEAILGKRRATTDAGDLDG